MKIFKKIGRFFSRTYRKTVRALGSDKFVSHALNLLRLGRDFGIIREEVYSRWKTRVDRAHKFVGDNLIGKEGEPLTGDQLVEELKKVVGQVLVESGAVPPISNPMNIMSKAAIVGNITLDKELKLKKMIDDLTTEEFIQKLEDELKNQQGA